MLAIKAEENHHTLQTIPHDARNVCSVLHHHCVHSEVVRIGELLPVLSSRNHTANCGRLAEKAQIMYF